MAVVIQFPTKDQRSKYAAAKKANKDASLDLPTWNTEATAPTFEEQADLSLFKETEEETEIRLNAIVNELTRMMIEITGALEQPIVLSIDDPATVRDLALTMETIRSMLLRAHNMPHPLQSKADRAFTSVPDKPDQVLLNSDML